MTRPLASLALWLLFFLSCQAWADPSVRREGAIIFDGVPAISDDLTERYQPYRQVYGAELEGWDVTGGLWFSTRRGQEAVLFRKVTPEGKPQDHRVLEGGSTRSQARPRHSGSFLVAHDAGKGAELQQLYLQSTSRPKSWLMEHPGELLTDGRSRYMSPMWSPDGKTIVCASNERNGTDLDVTLLEVDKRTRRTLTTFAGAWMPMRWSPDGKRIVVGKYEGSALRLNVLTLETGVMVAVDDQPDEVSMADPSFTRAGQLLYLSDRDSEFRSLHQWDPETGRDRVLLSLQWDISAMVYDRWADRIVYAVNEHGRSSLYNWQLGKGPPRRLNVPDGVASRFCFSSDGARLAFQLAIGSSPPGIYSYDFLSGQARCWMTWQTARPRQTPGREPRLVGFPSFDRRKIFAYVYQPVKTQGPRPVLLYVHGGPELQFQPIFSPFLAFLVDELGITVVAPNIRGSDGYGKSFRALDNGPLREDAIRDMGALLDWVERQPDMDASRVAIAGGSYGGYVSLACLAAYPDRLRAGICVAGISDFVTCAESRANFRADLRRREYGDERDPQVREYLDRLSPLKNSSKITSPLLVSHGRQDIRCPVGEAEQIVSAVRKQGGECWYLLFEDEGHAFTKRPNLAAYELTAAQFLDRYLVSAD